MHKMDILTINLTSRDNGPNVYPFSKIISDLFKRMRWGSGWMFDVSISFGRFRLSFTFESSVREMRNDDSWRHPCCPSTPAILFLLYRKVR